MNFLLYFLLLVQKKVTKKSTAGSNGTFDSVVHRASRSGAGTSVSVVQGGGFPSLLSGLSFGAVIRLVFADSSRRLISGESRRLFSFHLFDFGELWKGGRV